MIWLAQFFPKLSPEFGMEHEFYQMWKPTNSRDSIYISHNKENKNIDK